MQNTSSNPTKPECCDHMKSPQAATQKDISKPQEHCSEKPAQAAEHPVEKKSKNKCCCG